ncbi:8295_t:CDS:2 [Paraglomus brasilianum]|uniref:8295_t:CDS:1 n=1 Tax=Paraglomus brasilianum TaxID=144538 RepID=A0A9N9FLV1_9GLOM|nr:8295_t:CDS:2 [Paraglomus brasilianum]
MSNKRRQRHFVISHSANKKPRYFHNSGLELVSSSEDDTDPSSSIAPSISRGSSCPRCIMLNKEIKWLRLRVEKYEESMLARINKLERLLALALSGQNDDNSGFGVPSSYLSMVSSIPEGAVNFGEITVSSMENPDISVSSEASGFPETSIFSETLSFPEVSSDNLLPETSFKRVVADLERAWLKIVCDTVSVTSKIKLTTAN